MGRICLFALAALPLFVCPAFCGATVIDDLYGTWNGTWTVEQTIDCSGAPGHDLPNAPLDVRVDIGPLDPLTNVYGTVTYTSNVSTSGDVVGLLIEGQTVTITICYSAYTSIPDDPAYYAHITGTLDADTLTGRYDEANPAPPGWTAWFGTCELTLTPASSPDPSTVCLTGTGLLWMLRRRLIV